MPKQRNIVIAAVVGALLAGAGIGATAATIGRQSDSAVDMPQFDEMPAGMTSGSAMSGMMGMSDMAVADEFSFLAMMIPHHEEAITAAEVLKAGTDRPEMREFAQSIIDTQTREVVQMRTWLAAWYPGRDTSVDYTPMMRDLTGLQGDALDRAFLDDMIPHHMAAVMMSQQLLSSGLADHTEVEPFAQTIRDAQRAEIMTMHGWLADWFGVSGMSSGMSH
ncbi:MAG: DUF305 domain-containing protein [Salinibacterium sp.]|nr:DUF305 domain-containing protein [Salinibacterium sp.]